MTRRTAESVCGSFRTRLPSRGTRDRPVWLGPARPKGTQQSRLNRAQFFAGAALAVCDSMANPFRDFGSTRLP
jgi:hypothetical protein